MTPPPDDLSLSRQMITRAESLRPHHPGRALELARAGRALAATVDRVGVTTGTWLSLQADAWSAVGSAARARGALREAEQALNVAIGFVHDQAYPEEQRLIDQCRLAQRAAYLRSSQGRHGEALDLIDDAIAVQESLSTPADLARCRVDRAAILAAAGRYREALAGLIHTLEADSDVLPPRTRLAAVHNAALYFHHLADGPRSTAEALRWLRLAIQLHQRHGESIDAIKLRALLGLTAARQGEVDHAMTILNEAAMGFGRHGAIPEHTMALLDLARLALAHGRPEALTTVAGQLFPLLQRLRPAPEIRQGVLDVVRAIHQGRLRPTLVERAAMPLRASAAHLTLREI